MASDTASEQKLDAVPSLHGSASSESELSNPLGVQPSRAEAERRLASLAKKYDVNRFWLQLKVDIVVVIPISVLYLLAFLDRVNISNAQVYGLSETLKMDGRLQFSTALAIFFVPYVVFEVPSNFILKKLKPHVWLSALIVVFGGVTIGQGFVQNYGQLLVTRFFLGLSECAMFPGCFYLLSTWYRRDEAQKRYSFFFASTSLAGAFGGLIAYAINGLNGKCGLENWRWLFIIEGAVTAFLGILLYFLLADFPEDAKFITENERAYIQEKLSWDQGESYHDRGFEWHEIWAVFKSIPLWLGAFMYFGLLVGAYGYAYFATAIIKTFNYSQVKTQVYSIFPWITASGMGLVFAFFSDLFYHRYLFTLLGVILSFAGYIILLATDVSEIHTRYAACFLVVVGVYGTLPLVVCWTTMNFAGHYRKMVSSAFIIQFGNMGGIVATFLFLPENAPQYYTGLGVSLGMTALSAVASLIYLVYVMNENKMRRQGRRDEAFDAKSPEDRAIAGDLNPHFVYQY